MITSLDASLGNDHVRMHLHKARHHENNWGRGILVRQLGITHAWSFAKTLLKQGSSITYRD